MNAHTPTTAPAVPKAVRDAFFQLDDLIGRIKEAATVFDTLVMMDRADLAFFATNPIHEKAEAALEVLRGAWDEAMGKAVAS